MTNTDIQQAREWAHDNINGWHFTGSDRALAAARVIQSLPDIIVDGDKLRQIIDFQGTSISEEARKDLESLLTPSLPTLAELIEAGNDPQQYQWMQAESAPTDNRFVSHGVITAVNPQWLAPGRCMFLAPDGFSIEVPWEEVTPFPDLPRLEWLGSGDAPTIAEQENVAPDQQVNPQVNLDSSLPRPEDVPAGEVWEVETPFTGGIGYRSPDQSTAWFVTYPNHTERNWNVWADSQITLVSRLVPETP